MEQKAPWLWPGDLLQQKFRILGRHVAGSQTATAISLKLASHQPTRLAQMTPLCAYDMLFLALNSSPLGPSHNGKGVRGG